MSKLAILGCAAAWVGLVALGCGGPKYPGDKRFPLSGSVSFDGQPVDLGSLTLKPAGGEAKSVSGGVIRDGKFEIPEAKGPNAGTYRAEIHWLKLTGKRLMDHTTGEMYDERLEALPPKFHKNSELLIEIPATDDVHAFELSSK